MLQLGQGGLLRTGLGWGGGNQVGVGLAPTFCCSRKQPCFKTTLVWEPWRKATPGQECKRAHLHRRDGAAVAVEVVQDRGGSGPWRLHIHSHCGSLAATPLSQSLMSSAVTQTTTRRKTRHQEAHSCSAPAHCACTQLECSSSTCLLAPCTQQPSRCGKSDRCPWPVRVRAFFWPRPASLIHST